MLKPYFIALLIAVFFVFEAQAQPTKQLTIDQAVLNTGLTTQNIKQLKWRGKTDTYTFVDTLNGIDVLFGVALPKFEKTTLLTLTDLNKALKQVELNEIKRLPLLTWVNDNVVRFEAQNHIFTLDINTKAFNRVIKLPETAENFEYSDGALPKIAFTKNNNLGIKTSEQNELMISNEPNAGIIFGKSVHRQEFGIEKGIFWSNSSNQMAFYKMNETMVSDYPLVNTTTKPAQANPIKYPMAGDKSHEVVVGIYNFDANNIRYLKIDGDPEHYLTNITWSPNDQQIYVAVVNRAQNHLWLQAYDAYTGAFVKTILEEVNEKYVEPEHGLIFLPNSNTEFLWFSERNGYNHLYHYNTDGKLLGQITQGTFVVGNFLGFDANGSITHFTANKENPMQQHAYSVHIKTKKITLLTPNEGTHTAQISYNGKYIIDNFTAHNTPRIININNNKGETIKNLLTAPNPLADYQIGEMRPITLQAADGTPLYGKIMLPYNFDANKKYPVIVYLYGGPHLQLVTNRFPASGNLWYNYMNQKGYIVFTMDNRGSENRGLEFEQATFRQLGVIEMQDQIVGINYLKKLPYIDSTRLGVHGWSFGGFMATNLATQHPKVFKVAVAGGPVIDWKMYEVMYTERYMDTPQENPEGYEKSNLLNYTKNLQAKLLMIHGTIDDVVVWQHSLNYVRQCVDEGILLDYFVYPEHPHNVRGKDRVHLMRKISDYFETNL
jgi:dipeptidyl-peptidase-4